ncbi:MAG: SPOR domain-containing protein [Alphaproteobacteria bacterium]
MSAFGSVALGLVLAFALAACAVKPASRAPSPSTAAAPDTSSPPVYRVGDSLTFEENGDERPIFVTAVNGDEISWTDNSNAKWVTFRDPTVPPRSETPAGGGPALTRSFDPAMPTVFPLVAGKQVSYKVVTQEGDAPSREEREVCEVRRPEKITVEAGTFTAWQIACQGGESNETLYYAPEIGAIVLSERDTGAKIKRLTLTDYQKTGVPPPQVAAAPKTVRVGGAGAAAAGQTAADSAATEPAAPPAMPATAVAAKTLAPPPAEGEPAANEAGQAAPAAAASPAPPEAGKPAKPAPTAKTPAAAPAVTAKAAAPAAATKPPAAAASQLAALPSPAAVSAPPTASAAGKYLVQYVSFRSPAEASRDWNALRARLPRLLGELKPQIDTVTTVGGMRVARLSLGPFESETQAKQLCADLHAAGPDCWVRPLK